MIQIPTEYGNDLHPVQELISEIDTKDKGLSDLALMSVLCDIGNRTLLAIGISGTGKSTVAYWIADHIKRNKLTEHGITVNGLKSFSEQLDNNSTTIIVEDLSRSGTDYMQINTVAVLAGLVYTGSVSKHNATLSLAITNMKGSALIYAQPLIMKKLVRLPEFESDISDKTIRYYHLVKPPVPHPEDDPQHPQLTDGKKWSTIDRTKIEFDPVSAKKYWKDIVENFTCEVSLSRAIEHGQALLKASALFCGRTKTTEADAWLVRQLSKNFRIEMAIFSKQSLEGPRELDEDFLPLLTVLASSNTAPKVKDVGKAFHVKQSQTYEILKRLGTWVQVNNGRLYATNDTKKLLRELGAK